MKIAGSLFHWFYAIFNCFQIWLIESAGAINCYSCMSYIYGANWEYLEYKDLYFRPAAFTDRCTNISEHGGHIGRIPCLHNCILIVEKMRVGARGHNGYIRGCYDHIFRHGFNDSSVLTTKLKYREFCTRTMMSSLIARKDKPPDTELFICSCRDSLCNRSNTPRSNSILITAIIIHIITIITSSHVLRCGGEFWRHLVENKQANVKS
ncbi:hypothetical protein T01_5784, partial [Trichinella spiralis]